MSYKGTVIFVNSQMMRGFFLENFNDIFILRVFQKRKLL